MDSTLFVGIISTISAILGIFIGAQLNKLWDRKKMKYQLITDILKPVEDWLSAEEKIVQIFGDSCEPIVYRDNHPSTYTLEDSRESYQFVKENRNKIYSAVDSLSTHIPKQDKLILELSLLIREIEFAINQELLVLRFEPKDKSNFEKERLEFIVSTCKVKEKVDKMFKDIYNKINCLKRELI